jgi:cell division protein FtsL
VRQRKGGSIRPRHFLLMVLFLFLLAGISHVWVSFKRTEMGYTLSQLKREIVQLRGHNRKLMLEMAFLKSPENLEKRAVNEFGLTHPLPQQIIYLP